ncbi:MAG: hypothetical protein ACK5UQ_10885, partial [Planctomycetota bacterium]
MNTSATTSPTTRGRPVNPNSTSGKIRTLLASGMEPGEIAKKLGCSASPVYNVKTRMTGGGSSRRPPTLRCTPRLPITLLSPETTGDIHGLRWSRCGRLEGLSGLPRVPASGAHGRSGAR